MLVIAVFNVCMHACMSDSESIWHAYCKLHFAWKLSYNLNYKLSVQWVTESHLLLTSSWAWHFMRGTICTLFCVPMVSWKWNGFVHGTYTMRTIQCFFLADIWNCIFQVWWLPWSGRRSCTRFVRTMTLWLSRMTPTSTCSSLWDRVSQGPRIKGTGS